MIYSTYLKLYPSVLFFSFILLTLLTIPYSTSQVIHGKLEHSVYSSLKATKEWKLKYEFDLDLATKNIKLTLSLDPSLNLNHPVDEFYALRLLVNNRPTIEKTYPACWFGTTNETLRIHLDAQSTIFSFDLMVPVTQNCNASPRKLSPVHVHTEVMTPIPLPTPEFLKRPNSFDTSTTTTTPPSTPLKKDAASEEEPDDLIVEPPPPPVEEPSFIKKYWMYIVPILIFLLFSNKEEPPQNERSATSQTRNQS